MSMSRIVLCLGLVLGAAGCANIDTVTRGVTLDMPGLVGRAPAVAPVAQMRNYAVQDVVVNVPQGLSVSEANHFYPLADIVWRGDPIGDRHTQIADIFRAAAARGAETLDGARPVIVQIDVKRFHGVTERTRFSFGGVYDMVYDMTVFDATTGAVIEPAHELRVDLPAPGGQAAIELDRTGQTEKVRVTDYLTLMLKQQLEGPVTPSA